MDETTTPQPIFGRLTRKFNAGLNLEEVHRQDPVDRRQRCAHDVRLLTYCEPPGFVAMNFFGRVIGPR